MTDTRSFWIQTLDTIARPVLLALSEDRLKMDMPVRGKLPREDRMRCTHLEALGRTLTGIAPWLESDGRVSAREARLRDEYRVMARKAVHYAVTPGSADEMNFSSGMQPIVDAAFLCHAVLRAPRQLWELLPPEDRDALADKIALTRSRKPYVCNWLLFSAMNEVFLRMAGREWDRMRVDMALRMHFDWYKGDGFYGDGPDFHMDMYNSFVIHPMLTDILEQVASEDADWERMRSVQRLRASRYASILEKMIMPDGSYPVLGRSSAYRFGCFHMLAQAALEGLLPEELPPASVRCALNEVIRRTMAFPNLDEKGYLEIGVCGRQEGMGEEYISTGSLYLCLAVFLPLGLDPEHPFWAVPDAPWTQKRIWRGDGDVTADHAL